MLLREGLEIPSVAILILLSASAGARVVATYGLLCADGFAFGLLAGVLCGGSLLVGVAQFLLLLFGSSRSLNSSSHTI